MTAPILRFKRGLLTNLPGLRAGEPGFTIDTYDLYVGLTSETSTNKFFGSHRYWTKETTSSGSGLNLVEGTSNGSSFITLKSPNSLSGIVTYTFPATPVNTHILTTDGNGVLSWTNSLPAASVLSGITTFTDTTNNTLGNENTGSVQLDGGMGIAKNLTVKENFHVGGYSEFIGAVTFSGGTINLGDSASDNINVGGEFISGLNPNDDNTYDIGISTQRWRNAHFAGIGTFATGAVVDNIRIGISGSSEIDTFSGNLTLDSATGSTIVDDDLTVTGNLFVNGSTTQVNSTTMTVEDRTIELGRVDGNDPSSATTWDLGVLFNYYSGSAKKSAVFWEHVDGRFKFASVLAPDTEGTNLDTPQLSVTTFAPIEVAELWINNTCTGGTQQVIGCISGELNLQNITIDAGSF